MKKTLVASVYDYGHPFLSEKTFVTFFAVFETKDGYIFEKTGRSNGFDLTNSWDREGLQNFIRSLEKQGYVSKAEWLKKSGNFSSFDASVSGMMRSSLLKDFGPLDQEKVGVLYQIIKSLGYFNLDDLKVIYTIITEYQCKEDIPLVTSLATFLTQIIGEVPYEETDLVQEHQKSKVYSFLKRNKENE